MNVKVKFVEGFKDGNILPRQFAPGEEVVLTPGQLEQVQRSGGVVEVIENVIPNPLKEEKLLNERERKDMPDPQNAENSINKLEDHVPGLEDDVEEQRAREAWRRADKNVEKVGAESVFNNEPARIDAEAEAKVVQAQVDRQKAHEAELEKGRQEEQARLEEIAKQEAEEAKEAKLEAEKNNRKKSKK